ncbi:acyltransferase [Mangrovibacterium marinum]|uniref:Peptidoglycan/LPS O-acetylase OafA/YrhL n=1 Tax=Mangrovibacterium marinum TaxID=1639118 RepID=A0A2T5C6M1_9BACT|nr:acyltransferase [Mangrovibacterium marinum]PTN10581.1 peptidoglycan/LPS O-acetylase OafA/YrhL [Mangrovibacterium marinum]
MTDSTNAFIQQHKAHFHILDGLRGIAALAVVIFHFMEWIKPDFTENFIGHGFLAVDFFFCLSGFVIGYAYDSRLPKMGVRAFFTSRLIRLHPLVIAGAVLGLLGLLVDPFANQLQGHSLSWLALLFMGSLAMIPLPIMEERYFNLFSLNAPAWSLFWEYIANIVYALVLVRLSRKTLAFLLLPAAAAIVWVSYRAGNLLGGWDGSTFADGAIRMSYSFLAGLFIFRSGWIIKNKLGFAVLALLLAAAFVSSGLGNSAVVEPLIVLFYFPLLVSLGAGSVLSGSLRKVCVFMGDISYPLYMTHYAGIWLFGHYLVSQEPSPEALPWIVALGTVAMVLFAWLVMTFYDKPVRQFLSRARMKRRAVVQAATVRSSTASPNRPKG